MTRPVQPHRTVLRRYTPPGDVLTADLECGHTMPCSRWPMATALRCPDCPPVRTYVPPQPQEQL